MGPLFDALIFLITDGLLWCIIGVILGVIFGAIPGLGGGMLMALALPFTFGMDSTVAQVMLVGMYVGAVSGSLISAVLIGIPGSPAAVMTTLDGYAMTRQGLAAKGLAYGITASFLGGLFAGLVLLLLSIPLASIASQFRSFDYFAFVILGLVLVGFTGGKDPVKGLISGFFGIFVAMIGFDQLSAVSRFSFGIDGLRNGFDVLPMLIGVFAVRQVLGDVSSTGERPPQGSATIGQLMSHVGGVLRYPVVLLRSSMLGSVIGILPGIGANVGAILSYTLAKALSKTPEKFGEGSEEGILAAESGNNATVGGALVPMIALGIPGSPQDVILMAALILHSIQPGPLLIIEHPETFYGIIVAYFLANFAMLAVMLLAIRALARVIQAPIFLLVPIVLMFCVVGVISVHNQLADAWVMFLFGLLGVAMAAGRFPIAPFVIGYVLGPLAETNLRSALSSSDGDILPLFSGPFAPVALLGILVTICLPLIKGNLRRQR